MSVFYRVLTAGFLLPALITLLSGCVVTAQFGLNDMPASTHDHQGVQAGSQAPAVPVYNLAGKPGNLSLAWRHRPALIVTGSYTCPVTRRSVLKLPALQSRYGQRLNIVILYVTEPHPDGDPSPYTGEEWVTVWNRMPGILHRQPRSLQQRIKLARRLGRHIGEPVTIRLDNMDNTGWSNISGGPNSALLVDREGTVLVKQGWFDWRRMRDAVDDYFGLPRARPDPARLRSIRGPRR